MDRRLSKSEILRGHDSFSNAFTKCRVYNSEYLKLYISESGQNSDNQSFSPLLSQLKVGFIVSKKKVKSSVKRNYLKRILKEIYRNNKSVLNSITGNCILVSFNDNYLKKFDKLNLRLPLDTLVNDYLKIIETQNKKFIS